MAIVTPKTKKSNFEINIGGISSKVIDKSFGRPEDKIEVHIYDLKENILYSDHNFRDFKVSSNETIPESSILEPTSKEPKIANPSAKGAGDKDYQTPGPNQAKDGYWFNTGNQMVWVSEHSPNDNSEELTSEISVDPVKILNERGYSIGKYVVKLNFQRNKIFDLDQNPFIIKEISPSRREIRAITPQIDNNQLGPAVNAFIYEMEGSIYFKDFVLNFGKDKNIPGINILLNKNTSKYEILFKTLDPLPVEIQSRKSFKLVETISDSIIYEVNLGEPLIPDDTTPLRGPNYNIDVRIQNSIPSCFHTYDDLLNYNATSSYQNLINRLGKNEAIHIDYSYIRPISGGMEGLDIPQHFENFIHFGSAIERLKNFEYKLKLIETYGSKINKLNTIVGGTSGSTAVLKDKHSLFDKQAKILKELDGYERFMYYESGTFAWPKVNSIPPYKNNSYTSSEAKIWLGHEKEGFENYGGQLLSASYYDRTNPHSLSTLIPGHIKDNIDNNLYTTFISMIGQHFDYIWTYIKHLTEINDGHHTRGISKDLVYHQLKSLGIDTFDQWENANLMEYMLGLDPNNDGHNHSVGSLTIGTYIVGGSRGIYYDSPNQTLVTSSLRGSTPKGDITKAVWKRLYHNAPYLLKTKGTERGIKALMSCYGVPSTILNIKEYGGSTSDKTTYQTFSYDKASLVLDGTSGDEGYFLKTKWSSSLTLNLSSSAKTVAFRIKPDRTKNDYHLFSLSGSDSSLDPILKLTRYTGNDISSSGDFDTYGKLDLYSGSYLRASTTNFPIYNGNFWNIFIGTNGSRASGVDVIKFGAYQSNYLKNVSFYTASVNTTSSHASTTFGDPFTGTGGNTVVGGAHTMYIGGTEANDSSHYDNLANLSYSGSIQEVRIYHHAHQSTNDNTIDRMLSHDTLKKQALAPFIYAGNHPSSSYDELIARLPLGGNLHKDSSSFHPNIDIDYLGIGKGVSSSMHAQSWVEIEETHHLLTPDTVGASATSEKVRIDSGSIEDDILSHDIKAETSTLDRQPPDYEDLGVFLSPTTEINEDIIYTLGAFRLDDYIGSPLPRHQTSSYYPDLKELRDLYIKKLKRGYNYWDYVKLIQQIDHTLFKMIEQWVPFKANLKTGLLIEPHYLERNKFPTTTWPSISDGQSMVSGSFNTINVEFTPNSSSISDRYRGNKFLSIHSKVGGGNVVTTNNLSFEVDENSQRKETGTNFTLKVNPALPEQEHAQAPIKPLTPSSNIGIGFATIGTTFVIGSYQTTDSLKAKERKYTSNTLLGNIQKGKLSRRYYSSLAIGNQNNLFENN